MIKFFRDFNPLYVIWLAVLLIILRVAYVPHIPDKIEFPFAELFSRLLIPAGYQFDLSPYTNYFLAGILVFGQAILINYLINYYNLLGKSTFLPGLMYITLSGLFPPFLMLSPPLVCNFLLIWMVAKLFSLYKGDEPKSTVYDLGMIVAAGTLIYLPFTYMFLAIWIALIIFRPFNWREWTAGLIGYITIFFFLGVLYYMNDRIGQFYDIWVPLGTKFPSRISIDIHNYLILIPVALILVLCFFKLRDNFFKSYVQNRKSFQLLFFIFLITGFSFYVRPEFYPDHFLLCAVPAAIFFAYYFLYAAARWFYETLYFLLIISIIYFQFNTF